MAGKRFINPYVKIALCLAGAALMAYFLYPDLMAGRYTDRLVIARGIAFLAFVYLLIRSLGQLYEK